MKQAFSIVSVTSMGRPMLVKNSKSSPRIAMELHSLIAIHMESVEICESGFRRSKSDNVGRQSLVSIAQC